MTAYSSIILDYLGADVAANRPVSLNIAPTALGLYTATDTGVVSAWYGSAWHTVVTEGASVSQIVAGAGLSGGTITTSGTIALGTIAAGDLLGNPGTVAAVPSAVAIGAGLSLSAAGTLSNTGILSLVQGSNITITGGNTIAAGPSGVTNIATTGGISGGPITSTGTLATDWNAGTVTVIGHGLTIDAGHTLQAVKNSRTVSTGFTLAASDSDSLIISNNATANVTITAPSSLGTGFNVELFNQNVGTLVVVPGAGTTLNGGGSTVFPLPIFTSTELVIDATGTNYSALPGVTFWNPAAGLVTALGTGLVLSGGTLSASAAVAQPILPSSIYINDTTGHLSMGYYAGAGGNAASHDYGVQANLSTAAGGTTFVVELRFLLPHVIPGGTFKLRMWGLANASSGAAKLTVADGVVVAGASPSAVTLTSETQTTITWAAGSADKYQEAKVPLTAVAVVDGVLVVAITFSATGFTLSPTSTWIFAAIWE